MVRQAIARREGFIGEAEAKRLRRQVQEHIRTLEAGDAERELSRVMSPARQVRERLEKKLARVAREQGLDQERLRRWVRGARFECGRIGPLATQ